MSITSLAVFCGSKNGSDGMYATHAHQLGKLMADNNITLIYGGGSTGIMGIVAVDHLLAHIDRLEKQGFLYETAKDRVTVLNDPIELTQYLP